MATFAANDTLVKAVGLHYPLGEVIFLRGLFAAAFIGTAMVVTGQVRFFRGSLQKRVLVRALLEGLAALLFTSSILRMPLAEASAIILMSPLILTGMAVVFYGENVGWRRWAAIGIGFAGAMLVVKPAPGAFNAWALVVLACAFVSASRDLITRNLDPKIPATVVSFMGASTVTLFGLGLGLFESWRPMEPSELAITALAGAFLALSNFFLVLAFRGVEVSAVSPFRYSLIIWAAVGGYLAFGEMPDAVAIAGSALIVAGGVYAIHRERIRQRELAAKAGPAP